MRQLIHKYLLPLHDVNSDKQAQQIVGLSASLGSDKKDKLDAVLEHLMRQCAKLLCTHLAYVADDDPDLRLYVKAAQESES